MVSGASTSTYMDLTAVVPALMEGIAQEVGVEMKEVKVILVGDETQIDVKPFQTLKEQYHQVEWDYCIHLLKAMRQARLHGLGGASVYDKRFVGKPFFACNLF